MIRKFISDRESLSVTEVKDYQRGVWIDIENADSNDIEEVARLTNLTYEDLADGLDNLELPRVETQGNCILFFMRTPSDVNSGLFTETLSIVISPEYFITISSTTNKIVSELFDDQIDYSHHDFEDLLIAIINDVTKEYTRQIRRVRKSLEIQKKDLGNIEESDIALLTLNEEILNQYLSSLVPTKIAIENLSIHRYLKLDQEESDFFQDSINNIKQSIEICSVNLKSIRSLRDSYQIIFTNRLNKSIKFLTGFTIVMTVPTILGSFFGMNVKLPISDTSPLSFWEILLACLGVSAAFFVYLLKKKML